MKTFIATVCLLAVICLPAAAESAENRTEHDTLKTRIYEGSVSLKYSFLASLGLETVHGVRFERPGIFLGGIAAVTYGTPQGLAANIGVFSRWYFTRAERLEIFLSLAAGYINYAGSISDSSVPPSMRPEHNYSGGVDLMPELGLGFRLKNKDAIDIALRWHYSVILYDSDQHKVNNHYPGISIGYRF